MTEGGLVGAAMVRRTLAVAIAAAALVLLPAAAHAAVQSAGNGVYKVFVDDSTGEYTAQTDVNHPQGPGLNVLFGNGDPGTTFNSIRSYTSGTDYDPEDNGDVILSDYIVSTEPDPLGPGFRITYTLPGPASTRPSAPTSSPDALTIVQDVYVVGTSAADSRVVVTMSVRNDGNSDVKIGIRYLWDYQIGSDDGPTFTELNPDGSAQTTEGDFGAPPFDSYRTEDNDTNPTPPTFDVIGTAQGPAALQPPPTPPDRLAYVCWVSADNTSFDYTTTPGEQVAGGSDHTCTGNDAGDSAVLYYWGATESSALTIAPGATKAVTAELGLTPPGGRFGSVATTPTPPVVPPVVAANRCVDLRRFKFKVHHGPGSRVVRVDVFINGKRTQRFRGRNLKTVTIQKFPQVFHTVKIVVHLSNGSTRTSRRVYLECTKGKPKIKSHHARRHRKSH